MTNVLIDFSNGLADAVERAGRSVVAVNEGGHSGVSGTVWRENLVVTAEHTVRSREEVSVVLPSGTTSTAAIVGRDSTTDIAVLRLKANSVTLPEFADPAQLKVGNIVLAVGRRGESGLSASYGVLSAIGGPWRTWEGGRIDQWFRLDLAPYPGFSGGPLVDVQGRVLGINTSGARRSVMTIPKSTVDRVVEQLLQKGRITRGYIGIGVQPVALPAALRQELKLEQEHGLLVITISAGGPAEQTGMMIGDIILAVGGKSVTDLSDLLAALDPDAIGKPLQVRVLRGGTPAEVKVTIGERQRA
jgi:S1-C subfamily serine protease